MVSAYPMDNKQLNFSRPLLSVRRGSSTAVQEVERRKTTNPTPRVPPLPYYKSELKSGPVRIPGVIPFQWEQSPGRPKEESQVQMKAVVQPPTAPKLPPGRVKNGDENPSDTTSKKSGGSKSRLDYDGTSASDSSSMYKNSAEFAKSDGLRDENGSSVSEGGNSTYLDALDSPSRSESLNCSVTDVSGLDGPDTKPLRTFSDPLARDFMIGRFLPAAKAVASDNPPHFGSKKQPVAKEQSREAKKVMISDKPPPRYYYTPTSLPQNLGDEDDDDEESEEEEEDNSHDFDRNGTVSAKLCGLLPPLCLLNPVPGLRDQVPRPFSSVNKIHKKPANSSTLNKTDKAIRDAIYEKRRLAVYQRSDMRLEGGSLKHELDKLNPQNEPMKFLGSLKCPGSERTNTAPYSATSGHSLVQRERGFLGIPEPVKPSRAPRRPTPQGKNRARFPEPELSADQEPLANPTAEKTLYIDSAQMSERRHSNSSSSESKSAAESRGRTPSIDSSLYGTMITSGDLRVSDVQQSPIKDNNRETDADKNPMLPLALPKSPSESWLSRTLPAVSSRKPKNPGFRASPVDPKWESVVKSSRLHSKHVGIPALTPISEN